MGTIWINKHCETNVWLFLVLMITKQSLKLMIIFQSVIKQDDFQSGNHKDNSSQREIMKKKTTSKRSVFQRFKLHKISL